MPPRGLAFSLGYESILKTEHRTAAEVRRYEIQRRRPADAADAVAVGATSLNLPFYTQTNDNDGRV